MLERDTDASATSEVLKWVREGGYTIRVDESGSGIFKRNGKSEC